MDVPMSPCPHCRKPGRVVLFKGKMTRRRICDTCRDSTWDVSGPDRQLLLELDSVIDYSLQKRRKAQ